MTKYHIDRNINVIFSVLFIDLHQIKQLYTQKLPCQFTFYPQRH